MKMIYESTVVIFLVFIIFNSGCSSKIYRLEEKLRHDIEEGKFRARIENQKGFKVKITSIEIHETFKEDYTYIAVVNLKQQNVSEEARSGELPNLGELPTTNPTAGEFKMRFRYLEDEDRWYIEGSKQ